MKRAIFFNINHTLITTLANEIFPRQGVKEGLAYYYNQVPRWELIGISNQDEIATENKSIEDAIAQMQYTLELLPQLSAIYLCPDFEGNVCYKVNRNDVSNVRLLLEGKFKFRKPGAGMIFEAGIDFSLDLTKSWMIGDRSEDEQVAAAAGLNFMWADVWRMRFTPGMYEIRTATPQQVEFLEGINLN